MKAYRLHAVVACAILLLQHYHPLTTQLSYVAVAIKRRKLQSRGRDLERDLLVSEVYTHWSVNTPTKL